MTFTKLAATSAIAGLMATAAFADAHGAACGPEGQTIRILGNDFPAIQAVAGAAEENCGGAAAEFTRNHTTEMRDIMNAALTPDPAEYGGVIVANATLVQLMNDGLLRPLNDLVEAYGDNISPSQLITIGGDVMAVAFMANSQHLFVRTDILEEAGVEGIPATYEEVLEAAEAIRAAGIMEHPLVMNVQVGWDLAEMFKHALSRPWRFLLRARHRRARDQQRGRRGDELEMLAELAEYAHPDHMSQASNETQAIWEAGQAALGFMWGSRGSAILDDEGSTEEVVSNTVLAAAPTVGGMDIPSATLWWDGFTIAANIPDEEAEATFAALASALNPDMVAANNDAAVWLVDGYTPGPAAAGVAATAQGGARPYPMVPQIGLLHNALGAELSDFMQGNESAEEALADAEAAYRDAAREAGFLQ